MDLEDVEFLNFFKGKRIKLTVKTSFYLGVVQRINPNKTLILTDVCGSNGCRYPGSKMFFGREIVNVELINEETHRNTGDKSLEKHLNVERFQPYRKTFDDEEEYINFVVIDEFHEKFGAAPEDFLVINNILRKFFTTANRKPELQEMKLNELDLQRNIGLKVMHIKNQHIIGVGADGVELFKNGRLCWLQIATENKVYLFDILLLGARAFKNGLSMILQNKHILKVIHDCRAMAGCLMAQFGVMITNVFDTQVADVMCFYSETAGFLPDRVSTLQEVVSFHLKVPSSQLLSLQMKSQLTKEGREMWQKRPCPVPLVKVMALSVIHLLPLRLVLLDTLMGDYMALVDSYLNSCYCTSDEIQHITMESALELPRELRQLEQMRSERQEWAAGLYPVTEQGLLARFSPRAKSQPETSPAVLEHSQTQAESFKPASSTQVDLLPHESPVSPPSDTPTSADSAPRPPLPDAVPDFREDASVNSPPSLSVGRGCTEALMDTVGRGRSPGKHQSLSSSLSQSFSSFRY